MRLPSYLKLDQGGVECSDRSLLKVASVNVLWKTRWVLEEKTQDGITTVADAKYKS